MFSVVLKAGKLSIYPPEALTGTQAEPPQSS